MTVRCQNELCVYWAQGACSHQAIRIDGEGTCMTFALAPVKPLPLSRAIGISQRLRNAPPHPARISPSNPSPRHIALNGVAV